MLVLKMSLNLEAGINQWSIGTAMAMIESTIKIIIAPTEIVVFHASAAKKTMLITAITPVNIAAFLYCGIKCQAFENTSLAIFN